MTRREAILSGLAYPVYQRTVASGRAAACLTHLRQLGAGLNAYLSEHEMRMPVLKIARESGTTLPFSVKN